MKQPLAVLRNRMEERKIDIYIVPTNDFHGSEYLNDYFATRRFLTGFTGSAGTVLVTASEAKLWTDGRYFLQAARQLAGSGIDLMKMGEPDVPTLAEYLTSHLKAGATLAFDGRVVSFRQGEEWAAIAEARSASVVSNLDLVGDIWIDRPPLHGNPIRPLPLSSAGEPYESKIKRIREEMKQSGASMYLIADLTENAWLYNFRGSDVTYTPVFFAYTIVRPDDVLLYLFDEVLDPGLIPEGVSVRNYFALPHDLMETPPGASLLFDPDTCSYALIQALPDDTIRVAKPSPAARLKAVKNQGEIAATERAHLRDGVAVVNFIYWLKRQVATGRITERGASAYLLEERKAGKGFFDLSFSTIAGYMEHGAIIHYSATEETDTYLAPRGFFLVDSGGQYVDGTTDITRTIALGPLTDRMKECYTAVLRGHIDLALAEFQPGTTGSDLDPIARSPIREIGLDYKHGTGHGIGHVLSVHEGPQSISARPNAVPLQAGMITSDEPGIYLENEFGIRIESELLCVNKGSLLGFRMLTLSPYERDAIRKDMLTEKELAFLNAYHKRVYESLAPYLAPPVKEWLFGRTRDL